MSRIYPYAGFWRRVVAFIIDSIVISIPTTAITMPIIFSKMKNFMVLTTQQPNASDAIGAMMEFYGFVMLANIVGVLIFWLYYALMESSKKQATLGKMAMGIKVVGENGGRITFARATGRTFAKYISYAILYFGTYMAGFTKKRQALHDIMATTYVVDNSFEQNNPLPELPFSTGGLVASIIVAVAPFVLLGAIGIMAALIIPSVVQDEYSTDNLNSLGTSVNATLAESHLLLMSFDDKKPTFPFTEDDITYTDTGDGLQAQFTDDNGVKYSLLLKKNEYEVCCNAAPEQCQAINKKVCK